MESIKINLHLHSNYSDGKNSIDSLVKRAVEKNLRAIAITDHLSNSWKARIIPTLNSQTKLSNYLEEISNVKQYLKDIGEDLLVFEGIEIDLDSDLRFITKLVNPNNFKVILLEGLESEEGVNFAKNLIKNFKFNNSNFLFPLFGLAHFNPRHFIHTDYSVILSLLKEHNLFLEINSSYIQYYSSKYSRFYKKIKEFNVPVSIGSDAHMVSRLDDLWPSLEVIENYGLQNNYDVLVQRLFG